VSSNREQIRAVLARPQERPLRAAGRSLAAGAGVAVLALLSQFYSGYFETASPAAYALAGAAVSLFLWGADRLWFSMVAPMFAQPFSIPAYCSRAPFWYLAGGIAFEAAVLAAPRLGLATLYGIPARDIFDAGARIGVLAACIGHAIQYPSVRRLLAPAGAPAHHS
jgi:hypothetical protein